MLRKISLLLVGLFLSTMVAAESELNFAKTVQNPLALNPEARYFALPFVNYTNFDYGENQNTQNILDLKPIMPFRFTSNYDLILRTIIPLTHQPVTGGYRNGLGDINPTLFLSPTQNKVINWGIGPTIIMPTATNSVLGAGKWSVGPELVVIAMPDVWTFALLTNNVWSVAGQANRPTVNEFTFQYFITYNFPHGFYVTTQPVSTANWMAPHSQQWTMPVGGGMGRVFQVGQQKMNTLLEGYYTAIRPNHAARWTIQASFEFLFPDQGVLN